MISEQRNSMKSVAYTNLLKTFLKGNNKDLLTKSLCHVEIMNDKKRSAKKNNSQCELEFSDNEHPASHEILIENRLLSETTSLYKCSSDKQGIEKTRVKPKISKTNGKFVRKSPNWNMDGCKYMLKKIGKRFPTIKKGKTFEQMQSKMIDNCDSFSSFSAVSVIQAKELIEKKWFLKRLLPLKMEFLNPLKYCIVFNFVFPQNSDCFGQYEFVKQDFASGNEYCSCFNQIISIEKNIYNDTYSFNIEPRGDKKTILNEQLAQYCYLKDWLLSLGNNLAKQCYDAITFVMQNNDNKLFTAFASIITDTKKRKYIKKLNKATQDYIKTKPYMVKIDKKNLTEASLPFLVKIEMNKQFCEVQNYEPNLSDDFSGFAFLKSFGSYNWFEAHSSMFSQTAKSNGKEKPTDFIQEPDFDYKDMMIISDNNNNHQNMEIGENPAEVQTPTKTTKKLVGFLEKYTLKSVSMEKRYFVILDV